VRRVFVDPEAPQSDAIQEAASWIRRGGVTAIPTDTLYGLAANPFDANAVARVFLVKGRPTDRALPLIASDLAQVVRHIGPLPSPTERLVTRFWPGPLTLLFAAPGALASRVTGGTHRVGVRVPGDAVARAVCAAVGHPITATSANLSGGPATADPDVVERTLGAVLDFLLDAGTITGGAPSTIVDVSEEGADPVLIRSGAIPWEEIQAWLRDRR
jgi:L-threonylcarbamoyladenylate synthase